MRRYLFLDRDIKEYINENETVRKKQFERLIQQGKSYEYEIVPELHPKKSTTYMGMAIINLSLLYLLTEEDKYLHDAKRYMMGVVKYEKWGNAHLVNVDLSASWIMFGLSLGYDWLKDYLSDEEKTLIKEKLKLQADIMYDYKVDTFGSGWSTNFYQNHNWINMTGLCAAGYALKDDYEDYRKYIDISKENFDRVFDYLSDDGSDYEGAVYWRYGVVWLFISANLFKIEEGVDYFKTSKFLQNTFDYRLYQSMPNLEEIANFGDCHDRRSSHSIAMYYKMASEYDNGYAQFLGNYVRDNFLFREGYESKIKPGILPEACFEYLWYEPSIEEKNVSDLPLYKHFEDLGLVVIKESWELDSTYFTFKCGDPGGKKQWKKLWELYNEENINAFGLSHHHPDNNSFILNDKNTYFAIDDGYNRDLKAAHHNVMLVDGQGYEVEEVNDVHTQSAFAIKENGYDPLTDYTGSIEKFEEHDKYVVVVGENGKFYKKSLNIDRSTRTIIYSKSNYFVMIDELESKDDHEYTFLLHGDVYPKEVNDCFKYKTGLGKMNLYSVLPKAKESETFETNIKAVMTTQEPDKFVENHMKTLAIKSTEDCFVNIMAFEDMDIKSTEENDVITIEVKFNDVVEKITYNKTTKSIKFE